MKYLILMVMAMPLLHACSAIEKVEDKVVDGVTRYCEKIPQDQRAVIRDRINYKLGLAGHSVTVTCKGDQ